MSTKPFFQFDNKQQKLDYIFETVVECHPHKVFFEDAAWKLLNVSTIDHELGDNWVLVEMIDRARIVLHWTKTLALEPDRRCSYCFKREVFSLLVKCDACGREVCWDCCEALSEGEYHYCVDCFALWEIEQLENDPFRDALEEMDI